MELKSLGQSKQNYSFDKPDAALLERIPFDNPFPKCVSGFEVEINALEFTSLCPVTGQPDYATINITYSPEAYLVESKSLKLYLMSFRNHGEFHESCIRMIGKDLVGLLSPRSLYVRGNFNSRGGISINPVYHYES